MKRHLLSGMRSGRVKALVIPTAVLLAMVVSVVGYRFASALGAAQSEVEVHQVDKSPEEIKQFWTGPGAEKAERGDPMPVIVDE